MGKPLNPDDLAPQGADSRFTDPDELGDFWRHQSRPPSQADKLSDAVKWLSELEGRSVRPSPLMPDDLPTVEDTREGVSLPLGPTLREWEPLGPGCWRRRNLKPEGGQG